MYNFTGRTAGRPRPTKPLDHNDKAKPLDHAIIEDTNYTHSITRFGGKPSANFDTRMCATASTHDGAANTDKMSA